MAVLIAVRPSGRSSAREPAEARARAITTMLGIARYSIHQSLMIYRRKNRLTIKIAFRGFDFETGAGSGARGESFNLSISRFLYSSFLFFIFFFSLPCALVARTMARWRLGAANVALLITSVIIILYQRD